MEVLAATQNPNNFEWFQGTADAVRQYLYLFEEYLDQGVENFLILSGVTTVVPWCLPDTVGHSSLAQVVVMPCDVVTHA